MEIARNMAMDRTGWRKSMHHAPNWLKKMREREKERERERERERDNNILIIVIIINK